MAIELEDKVRQAITAIAFSVNKQLPEGKKVDPEGLTEFVMAYVNKTEEEIRADAVKKLTPLERKVLGLQEIA